MAHETKPTLNPPRPTQVGGPWKQDGEYAYCIVNAQGDSIAHCITSGHAAFIVRACNSHDALVEAAEKVLARWERGDLAEAVRELGTALAAARGEG